LSPELERLLRRISALSGASSAVYWQPDAPKGRQWSVGAANSVTSDATPEKAAEAMLEKLAKAVNGRCERLARTIAEDRELLEQTARQIEEGERRLKELREFAGEYAPDPADASALAEPEPVKA
jgi:hypothetical protein